MTSARTKFLIGGALVLGTAGYLMATSTQDTGMAYLPPTELAGNVTAAPTVRHTGRQSAPPGGPAAYGGTARAGGNGGGDAHLLKFTQDGKFLMQVGKLGTDGGSNDPVNFGLVAKIWVDPKTNEAYVADGYKNKRVAVLDADTGQELLTIEV